MAPTLPQRLKTITAPIEGLMGICVHDLATGHELGQRLDESLPMASVCKLPILVAAYREHEAGRLDLAERVDLSQSHQCLGSGLFNFFDAGLQPSVHDLLLMMIVISDNTATDLVLERVSPARVTSTMHELGIKGIRLDRLLREILEEIFTALDPRLSGVTTANWQQRVEQNPEMKRVTEDLNELRHAVNQAAHDRDVATPRAMARLLAQLAHGRCASPASCEAICDILGEQQLNGRLPRDLPVFTKLLHKTGTYGGGAVVNDAGILMLRGKPVATIAALSRDVRNPKWETEGILAQVGRAVFDHYADAGDRAR